MYGPIDIRSTTGGVRHSVCMCVRHSDMWRIYLTPPREPRGGLEELAKLPQLDLQPCRGKQNKSIGQEGELGARHTTGLVRALATKKQYTYAQHTKSTHRRS